MSNTRQSTRSTGPFADKGNHNTMAENDAPVTISKLNEILSDFLDTKFSLLLDQKLAPIISQISDLELRLTNRLTDLEAKSNMLEKSLEEKNTEIISLSERIKKLESSDILTVTKLSELDDLFDSREADILCDNLILSGSQVPPVSSVTENTLDIAASLLRNCTKVNFDRSYLLSAQRVGKRPTPGSPDNRRIKIRLASRGLKHDIVKACVSLRDSCSKGLFLNEELTKRRNSILYKLRMLKKQSCNNMTLYTRDGLIKVRTSPSAKTQSINSEGDYERLLSQTGFPAPLVP